MLNSHRSHEGQRQPAQHQTQNQERPQQHAQQQQQQQRQDQGRHEVQQTQNPERQQQPAQQQQHVQDQSRQQHVPQDQNHDSQQQARTQQHTQNNQEQQRAWQNHRATSWQSDHRTWQQRGGYDGYRIPEDRYRVTFGPQHSFRISGRPFMVYDGSPRFQYEGYWITLLDPWPEYWSNNWYNNDDVYVDYRGDGYYMYNRRYPGAAIAISISM